MIDFLIIYELPQRELENVTLLGAELERRGYNICFQKFPYVNPRKLKKKYENNVKVIVTQSMYSDGCIFNIVYNIGGTVEKIVNLQWEQIGSIQDEETLTSYRYPKENAKLIPHICWGKRISETLQKVGMKKEKTIISGPIHMDFLRDEFSLYYMNRETVLKKYNIPNEKKVILFISSFSYVNLSGGQISYLRKVVGEKRVDEFRRISIESQKIILDWIEKFIRENQNVVFIYRNHPAENESKLLSEVNERNENFFVINDYSVKQWIKISDTIFTWFSTSVAEVHFSKKDAYVLRPIEVPKQSDVALMKDCAFITTYEEFETVAKGCEMKGIANEVLQEYYDVNDVPSYVRNADYLEKVISTDEYDFKWSNELKKKMKRLECKRQIRNFAVLCYQLIKLIYHNIRKKLGLSYNKMWIDIFKEQRITEKNMLEKQKETLERMRKVLLYVNGGK